MKLLIFIIIFLNMDDYNQTDDLFFAKYLTKTQSINENDEQKPTNITDHINQDKDKEDIQIQNDYLGLAKNQELKCLQTQQIQNKQSQKHNQIQQKQRQRQRQRQNDSSFSSQQRQDEDTQNDNKFQLLCQKYQKTINKSNSSSLSVDINKDLEESQKISNYKPRNQLQKHLTLSGEHLKQIQSILEQNQNKSHKEKQLFKTISFNGDKDQRLIIKNSLGKDKSSLNSININLNKTNSKQQQSSQRFNYDVIQSDTSQQDIGNKIQQKNKESFYLDQDRYFLIQSQQKSKSRNYTSSVQEKIQPFIMSQKQKIRSKQIIYENQDDEVKNYLVKNLYQSQDKHKYKYIEKNQDIVSVSNPSKLHKQSDLVAIQQTVVQNYHRDCKNFNRQQKCSKNLLRLNDSLQKNCSGCSKCPFIGRIQLQNKMQVELIQKVQNLQKMVNSLRKFKQNRQALQIQSNQSKIIGSQKNSQKHLKKLEKKLTNLNQDQIKQENYLQDNDKKKRFEQLKKLKPVNQKTKRHHKRSSQISCNSQETSKTSNFQKQSSKRGKSTSLLTQIKLLKAQVQYLQQEKRLRQKGERQKINSNREKSSIKVSSYSQTHLLSNNKINEEFTKRQQNKKVQEQQYYNNQTIKIQKQKNPNTNLNNLSKKYDGSPYCIQQKSQPQKINVEFNDLVIKPQKKKIDLKQFQHQKNFQSKNNKQKYKLYENMVSILHKHSPKATDGQKKLFDLAMKWYQKFIPSNLQIQSMSITKYEKFVHFRTNLLNFDILWHFNGKFYCGETIQVKKSENKIKNQQNKSIDIHKQGQGVQIIPSQYVYQGNFQKNKKSGYGVINFQDGDLYQGNWQKNKMTGRGTLTSATGDIYQGQMKDNQKHGIGKQYFQNGDKYKGQYFKGCLNGKGKYKWLNGSSYKGQFKNGRLHGVGVWKSGLGDRYEGEYENNLKHGYGIYQWKNGMKYQGYFFNGVKVGEQQGKFRFHQIEKNQNNTQDKNKKRIHAYKSQQKYRLF